LPGLAEGIAALPEASRKRIADGPVKLTFGHMPDAAGQAACRKALETAFGAPLDLTLAEDTGLLAGLEFSAPEIVLRNHLRADLDRMATTLAADD
jgi:F-type H+-transporting ATPase subunit b